MVEKKPHTVTLPADKRKLPFLVFKVLHVGILNVDARKCGHVTMLVLLTRSVYYITITMSGDRCF